MTGRQQTVMELFDRMDLPESNEETYKYPEDEIIPEIINTTINNQENIDRYTALYFDGEGYIGTRENKRSNPPTISLRTSIGCTDLPILIKLKQEYGGEIYVRKKQKEHHKDQWVWRIRDRDTLKKFLSQILPYSTIKKSQIELGLKFLEVTKSYHGGRGYNDKIPLEEYNTRKLIANKLKELKHTNLTQCELNTFNKQISEMNIDKRQLTMKDY